MDSSVIGKRLVELRGEKTQDEETKAVGKSTSALTMKELGELIKEIVGFEGEIVYDTSMPDGTPRKLLDSSKLFEMGWSPSIKLKEGLAQTYEDYKVNRNKYRG